MKKADQNGQSNEWEEFESEGKSDFDGGENEKSDEFNQSDEKADRKKRGEKTSKNKTEKFFKKIGKGIGKSLGIIIHAFVGMISGLVSAGPVGIIALIIAGVITLSGAGGLISGINDFIHTKEVTGKTDTIREELIDIGELAALEYNYTKVVQKRISEKYLSVFSKEADQLYSFDGTIKIGIDCSDLDIKVDDAQKQYIVYMPETKILSHETDPDSYQFYFDEIHEGREEIIKDDAENKREQEEKVTNGGLLDRARSSADTTIGRIIRVAISSTEKKDYEIAFYHADIKEEYEAYLQIKESMNADEHTEQ